MRTVSRFILERMLSYVVIGSCLALPLTAVQGQLTYWWWDRYEPAAATIDIDCAYYGAYDDYPYLGSSHETINVSSPPASDAGQTAETMVRDNVPSVAPSAYEVAANVASYMYVVGQAGMSYAEDVGVGIGTGTLLFAMTTVYLTVA